MRTSKRLQKKTEKNRTFGLKEYLVLKKDFFKARNKPCVINSACGIQ